MKGTVIAMLVISAVAVIIFAILIGMWSYGKNKTTTDSSQQQTPPDKENQPTPANADQNEE